MSEKLRATGFERDAATTKEKTTSNSLKAAKKELAKIQKELAVVQKKLDGAMIDGTSRQQSTREDSTVRLVEKERIKLQAFEEKSRIVSKIKEQEERRKTDAKRSNVSTIQALGGSGNPFSHGRSESGWWDHGRGRSRSRRENENRSHSRSPSMGVDSWSRRSPSSHRPSMGEDRRSRRTSSHSQSKRGDHTNHRSGSRRWSDDSMNRCSRSRSRSGDRTNRHSQSRSRSRRWSDDRMNRRSRSRSGDRTNRHSRSRGGDSSMDRRSRSHSRSRNRSNRGDDMCHRTSSFNPSMGEDRGSRHGHYRILDPLLPTPNAQLAQLEDNNLSFSNHASSQFCEDDAVGALLQIANPNGSRSFHSGIHSGN